MKQKLFYCFILICSLNFFTSCKDDKKMDEGKDSDWATEISGNYKGDLVVTVDGIDLGSSTQFISIVRENINIVKLELKDFIITIAGSPIKVGDIMISNIPAEGTTSTVMLTETSTTIKHPVLGQLDIKVTGNITGQKADLHIIVFAATLGQNIDVIFKGEKTSEVTDDNDYAADVAAWYKRESLIITGDTVNSKYPNDGVSVIYKDINTITIDGFYLSFPANVAGASTTRKIPSLDSILLVKGTNSLMIDTIRVIVAPQSKQDTAYLILSGAFEGKNLTLHMTLSTKEKKADYVFTGLKKLTGASINKMTINSEVIAIQPEIEQNTSSTKNVTIYVKPNTTESQLTLVPTFEISEGAILTYNGSEYIAGTPVDFSKECKFYVKSQSGKTNYTYVVKTAQLKTDFDFATGLETWETQNVTDDPESTYLMFDEPANGWATSNEGVKWIKVMFGSSDDGGLLLYDRKAPYAVEQTTDAKSGSKAAKLTTLYTTGANMGFVAVPAVTSGTVFSGVFEVDIMNTLKSTKFGYPCFKKPANFSGSYKYTPGSPYYYCPDPIKNANAVIIDNNKTDAPAINAVLYEVDSYAFDFLDGTNLLTSEKIVAKASLKNGSAQSSYTDFNIKFEWEKNKSFDSTKKYKLAIVCSSSKDGDKFTGAPGSILYVDDLKVTFE